MSGWSRASTPPARRSTISAASSPATMSMPSRPRAGSSRAATKKTARSGANDMSFELENILYETEDFLRRAIGSPTRRAAKRRRAQRKWEEFGRRGRRSGYVVAALLVLLLGVSLFSPGLFLASIFAAPVILFVGIVLMFQPTRHARRLENEARLTPQTLPLPELAVRAEEGLLDRCDELPGRALPAADRIMAAL